MYRRNISRSLRRALADTRVVLLNGARQTGKSTLAQQLADDLGGRYLTFDDDVLLSTARADPAALVRDSAGLTVIDEVQRAPELFRAIKIEVDRDQRPGRFLLTGSANVFLLPRMSESLAGRMEIVPLLPLSVDEIDDREARFSDRLFGAGRLTIRRNPVDRLAIGERVVRGGFPEAVARPAADRRSAWFKSYIASLVQRDIRDLANIEGLTDVPRLVALLAARAGSLTNVSELSRSAGISGTTLRRYVPLLEATFILQPLPAWSTNLGKRLVRSPKIHLIDSGLTAHLRGESDPADLIRSPSFGPLLETFVLQELRKQLTWARVSATPYHFRTATGREVDIVLEASDRRVVGIEVKASASVGEADFGGLAALAEAAGKKFVRGVIIYLGDHVVPFGDRFWAVPIDEIWQAAGS